MSARIYYPEQNNSLFVNSFRHTCGAVTMSQPSLPEIFAKIEEMRVDTALTQHSHYKDFTDLPLRARQDMVRLAHAVGLAERGLDKKDADWVQLRASWLELFGSTREALAEGCVSLKQNGEFCGRALEGDVESNSQRCGLHRDCHPFVRVGQKEARGLAVLPSRRKGDCLVCLDKVRPKDDAVSCRSCEGRAHVECVQQQFDADPSALEGENVVCFLQRMRGSFVPRSLIFGNRIFTGGRGQDSGFRGLY